MNYDPRRFSLSSVTENGILSFLLCENVNRTLCDSSAVSKVNDTRPSERFLDLWRYRVVNSLVPEIAFTALLYYSYCASLKKKGRQESLQKVSHLLPKYCGTKVTQQSLQWNIEITVSDEQEVSDDDDERHTEFIDLDEAEDVKSILEIFDLLQNSPFLDDNGFD